jgi:type II secretory pathway component PulF
MATFADNSNPLSARHAEAVLMAVADATATGAPLAQGLRAAAAEAGQQSVADQLLRLAEQLERGRPLDEVLAGSGTRFPGYLRGLLHAGVRSGRLAEALIEVLEQQRVLRELRRAVTSALAYPGLMFAFAVGVAVGVDRLVIGPYTRLYAEFGLKLPALTEVLTWFHRDGLWCLLGLVVVLTVLTILFRLVLGPARWRRVLGTVPLVGVLWHWSGVAELTRLWAILLEQQVPLPETLRLAAEGASDPALREVSRELARGVEGGRSLGELLSARQVLPDSLEPILGWGERTGRLAEACRLASEMFEGRVQLRSELLRSVLPPLLFVFVGILLVVVVVGLYLPMVSLISGLS